MDALAQAEKVAAYKELSPKSALHLRLLTEEMMGMMRSITGEPNGFFWIEDEDGVYQLHLQVKTRMNTDRRERLLSASSSGGNESAKGLMGRLRDFFDRGADEDVAQFASPVPTNMASTCCIPKRKAFPKGSVLPVHIPKYSRLSFLCCPSFFRSPVYCVKTAALLYHSFPYQFIQKKYTKFQHRKMPCFVGFPMKQDIPFTQFPLKPGRALFPSFTG